MAENEFGIKELYSVKLKTTYPIEIGGIQVEEGETIENYLKRLEKLETVAKEFKGVSSAYAIQAGREVRILVEPENIDDAQSQVLAHDIAKKIENELEYPGQIKVTVIREVRAQDIAK